jgi:hypothetical protein
MVEVSSFVEVFFFFFICSMYEVQSSTKVYFHFQRDFIFGQWWRLVHL